MSNNTFEFSEFQVKNVSHAHHTHPCINKHNVSDYFTKRSLKQNDSKAKPERVLSKIVRVGKNKYLEVTKSKPLQAAFFSFLAIAGGAILLSQGPNFFKASITDQPSPIAFDGTTYPYKYAPDWFAVGGSNNRNYSSYSPSEMVPAPRYNTSILQKDGWVKEWVNPQITYSIVYMGKYKFDHKEYTGSHPAIDIKLAPGTPVHSIANGIVVKSQTLSSGYGQHIVVRHDQVPEYGTLYSSYSHLSKRQAHVGDTVKRGQQIGLVGSTGNSTTAHIHFQIDKKDAPFYPYWPFTSADASAAGYNFTTAVNAGFGRDNALKYTIHPFDFIHKYETSTNLTASLTTETIAVSTPKPTPTPSPEAERYIPTTLGGFRLEASPAKLLSGERVKINILAANEEGNFFSDFNETVEISYPKDGKRLTEEIKMTNGEGEAIFRVSEIGSNKIIVSHKNTVESLKIQVIKPQLDISEPDSTTEEITDMVAENTEIKPDTATITTFSQLQISGPHTVEKGSSIQLVIRALDDDGKTIESDTFPERGGFVISSKNGSTSEVQLRKGAFSTGVVTIDFIPDAAGIGYIAVDDQKHQITITDPKEEEEIIKAVSSSDTLFTDIPSSHPNANAIAYLKQKGVINGYPDGSFQPDKKVNRGEVLKMIFTAFNVSTHHNGNNPFHDVSGNDWFANYVLSAHQSGVVKGYSDGSFKPEKTVSRSEYFKMLLNASGIRLNGVPATDPFTDVPRTSWFAEYAKAAKNEKLLDFGSQFFPNQGVSRAEVAESIYRLMK